MAQFLIDIPALMPSSSPLPGTPLPATGVACADASGQSALFAEALGVFIAGNQANTGYADSASLALSTEKAVPWLGGDPEDAETDLQTGIKSDHFDQQDADDLSLFLFQTASPEITITLDNEPCSGPASEAESLPVPKELPAKCVSQPVIDYALAEVEQAEPSPATVVTDELTQHDVQPSVSNQTKAIRPSRPVESEASSPVVTVKSTVTIEDAAPSQSTLDERGMVLARTEDRSIAQASVRQPNPEGKAAVESFLQAVGRFNDDGVPLTIEITPEAGATVTKTGTVETAIASQTTEQTPPEPVLKDSASVTKTPEPVHSVEAPEPSDASTQKISAPVDSVSPEITRTRGTRQPGAEPSTSQPKHDAPATGMQAEATSVVRKQSAKATRAGSDRMQSDPAVAKPGASSASATTIDTTAQESAVVTTETPVKSAEPLDIPVPSSDDSKAQPTRATTNPANSQQTNSQTAHTISSVSHPQAQEHTERTEATTPVRFEVEVPKPLRVPGQIRVHLDPPELGQVRIDLASRGDGIVGSLRFQSEQARNIVEREIGQLQKTLQDAGVRVERLEVMATSPGNSRTGMQTDMNNQQSWSQNAASQNEFTGNGRGHAGLPTQHTAPQQTAQVSTHTGIAAYPTMHAGTVNLVA